MLKRQLIFFLFLLSLFYFFFIPKDILAATAACTTTRDKCYVAHQLDQSGNITATTCLCYDGLVPCGKEVDVREYTNNTCSVSNNCTGTPTTPNCQLCHFFIMIGGIINYVVLKIVPLVAILLIVYAGLLIYFGGENPNLVSSGKNIIKYVAIGLFLIYGSFMLVGLVIDVLGGGLSGPLSDVFSSTNYQIKIYCTPTYY
jgi:hypothetical protein